MKKQMSRSFGSIAQDKLYSSLEYKTLTNCNGQFRALDASICNLVATNATIDNLQLPTCNVGVNRLSYFPEPDTLSIVQADWNTYQWQIAQFWIQNNRLDPFTPLLAAPISSTVFNTAALTVYPAPFNIAGDGGIQQFLDFLNTDIFAALGLDVQYGLQAQPAPTDVNRIRNPQFTIRSSVLNLTNYAFYLNRIADGVVNGNYIYAMDGGIPFLNTIGYTSTLAGLSCWGFGGGAYNNANQPQDAFTNLFQLNNGYHNPVHQMLGFSTCGFTPVSSDQQSDSNWIVLL